MGIESVVFSVMVLLWESPNRKSIVSILPCFKSEDNTKRTTTIQSLMKKEDDDDENEHVSEELSEREREERALVAKCFKTYHHGSSSSPLLQVEDPSYPAKEKAPTTTVELRAAQMMLSE